MKVHLKDKIVTYMGEIWEVIVVLERGEGRERKIVWHSLYSGPKLENKMVFAKF